MIKIDPHPTCTIQIGKCTVEFDKTYILTIRKIINGKTIYEADFEPSSTPNEPAVEELIISTVIRHLNVHGAFSPKNESNN